MSRIARRWSAGPAASVRPITQRRRCLDRTTRAPGTLRPLWPDHVIAKRPAFEPVVREPM